MQRSHERWFSEPSSFPKSVGFGVASRTSRCSTSSCSTIHQVDDVHSCSSHTHVDSVPSNKIVHLPTNMTPSNCESHATTYQFSGVFKHVEYKLSIDEHNESTLVVRASTHGSQLKGMHPHSWRARKTEIALTLIKELLHAVREQLYDSLSFSPPPSPTWRQLTDTLDISDDSVHSNTQISSHIVAIDWHSDLRWGGDDSYNEHVDGDIHLIGICCVPNTRRHVAVWERLNSPTPPVSLKQIIQSNERVRFPLEQCISTWNEYVDPLVVDRVQFPAVVVSCVLE